MKRYSVLFTTALSLLVVFQCGAQGTSFAYQGRLNGDGAPANGLYDLLFTIYDLPTGNGAFANYTNASTPVSNGLFTATLDFGSGIFTGPDRWLEIAVRTNGGGAFTNLSPRQKITAVPYAITAGNLSGSIGASQLSGTLALAQLPAAVVTNNQSGVNLAGSFSGNGAGVTNVNLLTVNSVGAISWKTNFGNFVINSSPAVGISPESVVAADVNGDGKLDLISADKSQDALTVLTNNGSGGFALASSPAVGDGPVSVVAADVNGDGKVDLISANSLADTLTVLTNNGSGGFVAASTYAVGDAPTSVTAADVNGDGKADLISANSLETTLTVLTNNGSGGFVASSTNAVENAPFSVVAVDVNGDAKVDLISANYGSFGGGNTLTVLTNNGSGGFTLASSPTVGTIPYSVAAADVNGDGKVDLISANYGSFGGGNTLTVLTNNGTGGFTLASSPTVAQGPYSVAAADVNGDGKVDLISANYGGFGVGHTLTVLTNSGSGGFALSSSPTVGGGPRSVVAADVNGDAIADLISANTGRFSTGSTLTVLFNTPASFTASFTGNGAGLTSLDASQLTSGTVPDARLSTNVALLNANQTFSGTFTGNGAGVTNINAATLGGLNSSNFWRTSGNSGTAAGTDFVGTTDNQPLELQVNATRALRIEPHGASAPSLVGGYFQNSVASYQGAVVAGGGTSGSPNYALGNYAFVGAGHGGQAAAYSAVVAGAYNNSPGSFSFIGSGEANTNSVIYSFIGGGKNNSIQTNANYSFLGGGFQNSIQASAANSVLGGGGGNSIQPNATYSVLGGGNGNSIQANAGSSVLGGGANNSIQTNAFLSFLGGGANNFILPNARVSILGGGSDNSIRTDASYSVLGGGQNNSIQTNAYYSVLGGGYQNSILPNGQYATIPGGQNNTATNYAFAAGRQAKANHQGSFVWADSTGADFASTAANQFNIRAQGGVRLNTDTSVFFGNQTRQMLNLFSTNYGIGVQTSAAYFRTDQEFVWYRRGSHSDAFLDPGAGGTQLMRLGTSGDLIIAGTLSQGSDRNIKQDFTPLDTQEVLRKVTELPIHSWAYTNAPGCRHVGPIAQDFHAAFSLNGNDDKHIATVDEGGVALAAIQGLNQKLEAQRAENAELKRELAELKKVVARLVEQR